MFRFAHSEYLALLYLIPVLAAFFWFAYYKKKKALARLASPALGSVLSPSESRRKYILKSSLILLSLTLLIISAANPQIGTGFREVRQSGIDIYVLLDVSASMRAEDIKPNRLEAAKHAISRLIEKLGGDRLGLIVFSGDAYVQFPLTTDYSAAGMILSSVDFQTVPQPGTAIAQAVQLASNSFRQDDPSKKAIIVISDGEDHEGNLLDAVKDASDREIKVYAAGIGTEQGAPIPLYNASGIQTDFKQDGQGNTVITRLNPSALTELASYGKGKYFGSTGFENQLDEIYNDMSRLQKTEYGTTRVIDYEDRFYYFLWPAVFLLLLEFFLSDMKLSVKHLFVKR